MRIIKPLRDIDADIAQEIQDAVNDQYIFPIETQGIHSAGSFIAEDQKTKHVWMLKNDANEPGQAKREACFWEISKVFGLNKFLVPTYVVFIDGKEFAAIKLIPWNYYGLGHITDHEGSARVQTILNPFLGPGWLHRLAIQDYILGNEDAHGNNTLSNGENFFCIDHGNAFQDDLDVHKQGVFIPYILRCWTSGKFSQMSDQEKYVRLPRVSKETQNQMALWFHLIEWHRIVTILHEFGLPIEPVRKRWELFKKSTLALDEICCKAWAGLV